MRRILPALLGIGALLPTALRAQDCAILDLRGVRYGVFSDTSIDVHIVNTSMDQYFSAPRFMLLNADGDIVALESFNWFALSPGDQTHHMALSSGQSMPPTPFTGLLVLRYVGMEGDMTCPFPLDAQVLCPPPACDSMEISIQSVGGADADAGFSWSISDEHSTVVAEGDLLIESSGDPMDRAATCLPPGQYTLHVMRTSGTGGQFVFDVMQNSGFFSFGPSMTLAPEEMNELPFSFHALCVEAPQGIAVNASDAAPRITWTEDALHITSAQGAPLGPLELLDAAGRCVRRIDARTSSVTVPRAGLSSGLLLVRSAKGTFPPQRSILP